MARFEITILGCGSATPTLRHDPTSQVANVHDNLYMIDCGELTQVQMRRRKICFNRLRHVFISHLHGDHCFGLPGLISTFGLLGRRGELVIHGPQMLEEFINPVLSLFCKDMTYSVRLNLFDPQQHALVMEDAAVQVYSIPLKHRVPTCGYLIVEKTGGSHLIREMADFYQIPLKMRAEIKQGADYVTPEGEIIPNSRLTCPADPPLRYAFCSDTAFSPEIIPWIEGVDCLYHEATFMDKDLSLAQATLHSTARQAAEIALRAQVKQLVIGHYSARYEDIKPLLSEAQAVFPGTMAADEGMVVRVNKATV
ncbi:MAG: ribonuclease Z [Tannerella sp.]|jgi:ribonuclease Z|nr:ribonuclease Z [Tannerella sp.]